MRRRTVVRGALLGCAGLLMLPCGFFSLMVAVQGGSEMGSPALAAEWRDQLNRHPDPDSARSADPEVLVVRCKMASGRLVARRIATGCGVAAAAH